MKKIKKESKLILVITKRVDMITKEQVKASHIYLIKELSKNPWIRQMKKKQLTLKNFSKLANDSLRRPWKPKKEVENLDGFLEAEWFLSSKNIASQQK